MSNLYIGIFKRLFDLVVAIVILILTMPFMLLVAILLVLDNEESVFFTQKRPGYKHKPFMVMKFRTMNGRRNEHGDLLPDNERVTKIGNVVRMLSLDELPQLLNVIKGDMSLVGPRPLLPKYLPLYSAEQRRRHDVKPGITGWAQVNGRNNISWTQKFDFDVYYVDNINFLFDMKILWLTLLKVIKREGTALPIGPFTGNN